MAIKKQHEEAGGGEGWLVSYCDMISLLVTFFLMMMTFSTSTQGDIKSVGVGLLRGRGGIFPNLTGYGEPEAIDPTVVEALAKDLDRLRTQRASEGVVGLSPVLDGLSILFDDESSFDPGSAELNDKLRADLRSVASTLSRYDQMIVVEGHTDGAFKGNERYADVEALAAARAWNAAQVLLGDPRIARDQVQIAAFGASRPRAPEATALGRKLNRRVEVRLLTITRSKVLNDGSIGRGGG